MAVSRRPVGSQTDDHAGMLDGAVRIVKLAAYGAHILSLGIHQKLFHPVHGNDLGVVVQQKHIVAVRPAHTQIIDGGIVETALVGHDFNLFVLFQLVIVPENFFRFTVVLHNDDFVIVIGGFFQNGSHRPP